MRPRPSASPAATIARACSATFRGLPHRTALVAEIGGVRFYDDSKGTNVGAAVDRARRLREPRAVLIAGGRDKGGSYGPLVDALARKGRAVVLLGEAADAIAAGHRRPRPRRAAPPPWTRPCAPAPRSPSRGDAVLLSPACSSFDMFRDYKHRGDEFVRAVRVLELSEEAREHAASLRKNVRRTRRPPASPRPSTPSPTPPGASRPGRPRPRGVVVALIGFGVVMVYSASAVQATVQYHDPQFFLKRQAAYAVGAPRRRSWVASRIDYHRLYKLTYPVLALVGILLLLCVVGLRALRRRRRALALHRARCTSSPPRWPRWRSSSGSPTRSRRRPSE